MIFDIDAFKAALAEVVRGVVREELKAALGPPRPLSKNELAAALGCSTSTVDRNVRRGMPFAQERGSRVFDLDACRAWLRRTAPHDLTPSQVAVAKVLDAWETWPGKVLEEDRPIEQALLMQLGDALRALRFVEIGNECLTDEGHALLARARKAGVLGVSTAERAAWARFVRAAQADMRTLCELAESTTEENLDKHDQANKSYWSAVQALRDLGVDVDALLSAAEAR